MRLSISVDSSLLEEAKKASGSRTKREAIERALHTLVEAHRRSQAIRHIGTIPLMIDRATLRKLRQQE